MANRRGEDSQCFRSLLWAKQWMNQKPLMMPCPTIFLVLTPWRTGRSSAYPLYVRNVIKIAVYKPVYWRVCLAPNCGAFYMSHGMKRMAQRVHCWAAAHGYQHGCLDTPINTGPNEYSLKVWESGRPTELHLSFNHLPCAFTDGFITALCLMCRLMLSLDQTYPRGRTSFLCFFFINTFWPWRELCNA